MLSPGRPAGDNIMAKSLTVLSVEKAPAKETRYELSDAGGPLRTHRSAIWREKLGHSLSYWKQDAEAYPGLLSRTWSA